MATTIGTAYVQILPTTNGITESLTESLSGSAETAGQKSGSSLASGIVKGIGGATVAIGAAATAAVAGVSKMASETAQYADNIDKASQKMGVSAEFYQEWDAVLQHSGTSMDSMTSTFKTLANAAQDSSADQEAAFAKIGLSMEQVQSMSTEELFSSVITGLQGMEEGTERTAIATDLLGRGAMEMGALLNTSAEDTQAMIDTVNDLGGVMSNDAVKSGAAFQDSLQDLTTAFSGVKNNLAAEFLPSLTEVMDGLTALFAGDDSGIDQINSGITDFVNNISAQLPTIMEKGTEIVLNIGQAIIDNLPTIIQAGVQLIVQLGVGLIQAIPQIIAQLPQIISAIKNGIVQAAPQLKEAGIQLMNGLWQGIQSMATTVWNNVKDFANNLVQGVKNTLGIHSPSKVFANIGSNMALGLAEGWDDEISDVQSDISSGLNFDASVSGNYTASGSGSALSDSPINIIVQSVLDGKVIGETVTKYQRQKTRAYGT